MNPNFRKVALIAAALGLLVSLYFALRPNGDEEGTETTTAAQTTTAATTTESQPTTAAPAPPPNIVTIEIVVGSEGVTSARRFSVKQGRGVVLFIRSELADEVHVHGYDLSAEVAPGQPALIEFKAATAGRFEVELESRHLPIAELEVRP